MVLVPLTGGGGPCSTFSPCQLPQPSDQTGGVNEKGEEEEEKMEKWVRQRALGVMNRKGSHDSTHQQMV